MAEGAGQRRMFDGVAQHRAGAMRLHHADAFGVDAEPVIDLADQPFLRGSAGGGDAVGRTILIGAAGGNDSEDRIAIGQRLGQRAQQHRPHRLARHDAVRPRAKGGTAAARRQHLRLVGRAVEARRRMHEHAAGQRHFRLAVPQALAGQMQRHQRAGAGGIDGDGRSLQIQQIGDARRNQRDGVAPEGLARRLIALEQIVIIAGTAADEHADAPPGDVRPGMAGILQRVPRLLQEQPLLRVHIGGFQPGNAEEHRVELVDPVDEAAMSAIGSGGSVLVQAVEVEAADRLHQIAAGQQMAPQRVHVRRFRETAAGADDGDRFAGLFLRLGAPHRRSSDRRRCRFRGRAESGDRRRIVRRDEAFELRHAGKVEQPCLVEVYVERAP